MSKVHIKTPTSLLTSRPFPHLLLLTACRDYGVSKLYRNVKFRAYGRECTMRRSQALFGPLGTEYTFSGVTFKALPMNADLTRLLALVNRMFPGMGANAILLNEYANGKEYISQHSDDERELTPSGVVTISLGAPRIFRIKDKANVTVRDVPLRPGEIVCMSGNFQQEFTHGIPKQLRVKEPRWSFTFRRHSIIQ